MKRLLLAVMMAALVMGAASAQDWRDDDDSNTRYNCDLIDTLAAEYGNEHLLQMSENKFASLSDFLEILFPACSEDAIEQAAATVAEVDAAAETDAGADAVAESDAEDMKVVVVLYDKVLHEWGDPACSILIDDFYNEDFTFLVGGIALDRIVLEVYLPGESEAATMDSVINDVTKGGMPIQIQLLEGDAFPMGNYSFDVQIDGETAHFMWRRSSAAMNTLSLICQENLEVSDDASPTSDEAPAPTDGVTDAIILEDGQVHTIEEADCTVAIDSRYDDDFNLSITGHGQDGLAVDVYLPDADEPLAMDKSAESILSNGENIPLRIEWAEGDDFPMGRYRFDVRIDDGSYQFEWERTNPAYRTFALVCNREAEAESGLLHDDEKKVIAGTMCMVWTEAWDEDLNLLIIGEPQDDISVAVTFPDHDEPDEMDEYYNSEFDDGTPYRVEWIAGRFFPLGQYGIDVTIEDEVYEYTWEREDSAVNTVGVECIDPDEAIPADEFLASLEAEEEE